MSNETPTAYYFGCWRDKGHYFWLPGGGSVREHYRATVDRLPWPKVDGALHPSGVQSEAALHHAGGWTALAMADRTVDQRGGSNSVFFFKGTLSFDAAVARAREQFAPVVARIETAALIFDTAGAHNAAA